MDQQLTDWQTDRQMAELEHCLMLGSGDLEPFGGQHPQPINPLSLDFLPIFCGARREEPFDCSFPWLVLPLDSRWDQCANCRW